MENDSLKSGAMLQFSDKPPPGSAPPGGSGGGSGQVYRERVCFNPHPKTLTMAGDYEYFAAQGHHPLAFALAELVDNALRATKGNTSRPRSIVVSLVVDDTASRGLVAVRDNGVGMTPQELNNWAVMNLSMEDRGLLDGGAQQPAGSRYLSGDIRRAASGEGVVHGDLGGRSVCCPAGYFGVGSKNAAFYLGRTVKVATRPQGGSHVHELCIRGDELERRFKAGEAVYEEDMVHRPPGATAGAAGGAGQSAPADVEEGFRPASGWLSEELGGAEAGAPAGASFTRVVVGDLKPDVLAALADPEAALGVLRDLAHLYHYYIHGPGGNACITPEAREQQRQAYQLPGGEALPDIVVELLGDGCGAPCAVGAPLDGALAQGVRWRSRLADVDDDLETRYLRAARATMEFTLSVQGMGVVEGVLWYFPFENDQETVPMDDATRCRMALTAAAGAGAASQGVARAALATLNPTQLAGGGGGTQRGGGAAGSGKLVSAEQEMQDAVTARLLQASPLFEAFWQGRLIPGACVQSLPFIDAVRAKRSAAARDVLPDEVFGRIRGALFFGPGWRVTRNKLMFRDNLSQQLADAVPGDRHLERHLREWLTECHSTLDRSVRFEGMFNQAAQAQARRELGEDVTLFERIHDGLAAVAKGDTVRLATKPALVGRVLWFLVPRVVHGEGCYSHGKVTVSALPAEVFGDNCRHTWPIRRIEGVVTKAELSEHVGKELAKLPSSLRIEPLKLASGGVLQLAAGATLPESTAEVVSGTGQRLSRALYSGHRQSLRVVQTLYYLGPGTWEGTQQEDAATAGDKAAPGLAGAAGEGEPAADGGDEAAAAAAAPAEGASGKGKSGGGGGGRKGRKRKQDAQAEEAAGGDAEGGGRKRQAAAAAAAPDAGDGQSGKGRGKGRGGRRGREETQAAQADAGAAAAGGSEGGDAEAGGKGREVSAPPEPGSGSGKGGGANLSGSGSQELSPLPPGAEVVLRVENKSPSYDLFAFQKLKGGLLRAGRYLLEYSLLPELPGGRTLGRRVRLQAAPGPAASFDLLGEGRAAAQARPLLLGEALPPLRLAFRDAVGNAAGRPPAAGAVTLEVLCGPLHAGGALVHDLRAEAAIKLDEDSSELVVEGLRIVGQPGDGGSGCANRGISVLRPPQPAGEGGGASQSGAQRETRGGAAAPVAPAELFLAVHAEGMVSQGFPLRLRPGAPASVELLPGHPFGSGEASGGGGAAGGGGGGGGGGEAAAGESDVVASTPLDGQAAPAKSPPPSGSRAAAAPALAAVATSGDELGEFRVRVLDAWGNATAPTAELPFQVAVASDGLEPQQALFPVDARGVGVVSGLKAQRAYGAPEGSQPAGVGGDPLAQPHALAVWPQVEGLPAPRGLEPSAAGGGGEGGAPAASLASEEDEALAVAVVAQSAYGPAIAAALTAPPRALRAVLGVLPSMLPAQLVVLHQGEPLQMLEEPGGDDGEATLVWVLAGRPGLAAGGVVEGLALRCLDEVGRPAVAVKGKLQVSWAKGSNKRGLGGEDVRLPPLQLPEVAGEPLQATARFTADPRGPWPKLELEVVLRITASPAPAASWSVSLVEYGADAGRGGGERDLSQVECGQPFYLEVQALDRFSNKCSLPPEARPELRVTAVHESPGAPLQLDNNSKWSQTQAGCDACVVKLFLAGPVGAVRLAVRDEAGPEGGSLLAPDELTVTLAPGPPAALAFDGPSQLQCGTRGVLGDLRLRAVDAWANLAESAAFEVALNGCALPADDAAAAAAKVAAAGSNRAKVKGGAAVFKGVKLSADAPGAYVLRASSATRKVAVSDALVTVQVVQHNFVSGLEVAAAGLPQAGAVVGAAHAIAVEVRTEDGGPLPWDAAAAGLQLRLEPAGGEGGGGGAPRAEAAVLLPDEDATRAAAGSGASSGAVCFVTPELVAAGRYRLTAQYTETRPELLGALPKADRLVRSPTAEFALAPGPPEAVALEGPSAGAGAATVGNGGEPGQRRILKAAAAQLRDAHGNAVPLAGVRLKLRLKPAARDGDGRAGAGGAPPELECESGALNAETDERGRAFFGDVLVRAGTGSVDAAGGGGGGGLELELLLSAQLPGQSGDGRRGKPSWAVAWRCGVLFTDDAARAETLRALQSERDALQQRLSALRERLQDAARRADGSRKEAKAAVRTAERCARQLGLRELPATSGQAAAALQARRDEAAAEAQQRPPLPASYGPPTSGMTQAIQRCLVSGDADVVGVFAQLVTVEDRRLAEVLSAAYLAAMQVVVVKTYECIARLREGLGTASGAPTPSMLSYTLIQPFSPETEGRAAARAVMRGASDLARRLAADATDGADDALPLVLPHTRMLAAMQERGHQPPRGADLAVDAWPPGCLGFAVNLLRPAVRGHRATVMYAQLGRSLVFEGMEQAARYRQLVTQVLRSSMADVFTLDGQKISGRGVVVGSSFRVPPLEETHFRFGSRGGGGGGGEGGGGEGAEGGGLSAQQEEAWQALVSALQQREAAEAEAERAGGGGGGGGADGGEGEEAEVRQRLEELNEQIKQQQQGQEQGQGQRAGGGGRGGRSGGKRGSGAGLDGGEADAGDGGGGGGGGAEDAEERGAGGKGGAGKGGKRRRT
ncbi:hypothetical protein Rsub_09586 [Raphidocelis subcapitata]|uniref:SMCHD1 ribosomal S5 domain-containing protein n=1 Tax=Raphidocelis subcapitata TaxID=307507 RepID=A0A2V0PHM8_9CHLO|nr:hypothetical protein Rsub_09586 [Raphidocelis subcapitata]|eukprot:GBF97420.1 hypothetical protein Rsub_09586 [Raphidocelis subcapitata]